MRGATPFFDDVPVGLELPVLRKGPLTSMHLVRWAGATENWHRIHYDHRFATGHDGLPDVLVNGSFKQQFLIQLLKDWAGSAGWPWKLRCQFRAMNKVGETLTVWGRVTGKREVPGFGVVTLDVGIRNDAQVESTPGTAFVALPLRGGAPLPRPFLPPPWKD